jgi:hypothetical protein
MSIKDLTLNNRYIGMGRPTLKWSIFFALLSSVAPTVHAEECATVETVLESVGGASPEISTVRSVKNLIHPADLARNELKLGDDGHSLFDLKTNPPTLIGNLERNDAPYLYEWAETPAHKTWVKRGGITKDEMDQAIEGPAQAFGKGWYVSTDVTDSEEYGHAVNIFEEERPLVVLVSLPPPVVKKPIYSEDPFDLAADNTDTVKRLQNAGVDAFRDSENKTWLSMIDSKSLRHASGVNEKFLKNYTRAHTEAKVFSMIATFETKPLEAKALAAHFPRDQFLRKIIDRKPLTDAEVNKTVGLLMENQELDLRAETPFHDYLRNKVIKPYLKKNLQGGLEDMIKAANVFGTQLVDDQGARKLLEGLGIKNRKDYLQIMEVFDFVGINGMVTHQAESEPITMDVMRKSSANFAEAEKKIAKVSKPDFQTLLGGMKEIFGEDMKFRTDGVVMGPNGKTRSYYIQTSKLAADDLSKNGLLTTTVLHSKADPLNARVYVEYPSSTNYQHFKYLLSPKLVKELDAQTARTSETKVGELNQALVKELTYQLLDPKKSKNIILTMQGYTEAEIKSGSFSTNFSAGEYYKTLVSIHPLGDGNGRLSRLYYEFLAGNNKTHAKIENPLFDTDLFGPDYVFKKFLKMQPFYVKWVAQAKDDHEFLARSEAVLNYVVKSDPTLVTMFPELKDQAKPHR